MLLPALADLKHAILVKSVLAQYSNMIPLGNCVLGLVSRILLGTAPAKEIFNADIVVEAVTLTNKHNEMATE